MIKVIAIITSILCLAGCDSQKTTNPEDVLRGYLNGVVSNDIEVVRQYMATLTEDDFEKFDKPKKYEINRQLEIGKDLKVVPNYQVGDLVFEVKQIEPDEIIYYQLRKLDGEWLLQGFSVNASFWKHNF